MTKDVQEKPEQTMNADADHPDPATLGHNLWLSKLKDAVRESLMLLDRNDTVRDRAVAGWSKTLPVGSVLLDIGAGACKYAPHFTHCTYTPQDAPGVDYSPQGVFRSS